MISRAAAAVVMLAIACHGSPTTRSAPRSLERGDRVPDLAATDLEGRVVRIARPGKRTLLDFWDRSCEPCIRALPKLAELYSDHRDAGFEIISITSERPSAELRTFIADHQMTWIVASDPGSIQDVFRVDSYPRYVLVGATGELECSRCSIEQLGADIVTFDESVFRGHVLDGKHEPVDRREHE